MSVANDNAVPEKSVDEILHSVRNMMESDISSLREESEASENTEVLLLTEMIKPPKGYKSVKDFRAGKKASSAAIDVRSTESDDTASAPKSADLEALIRGSLEPVLQEWLDKKMAPIIREALDKEIKNLVQSMVAEAMKKSKTK